MAMQSFQSPAKKRKGKPKAARKAIAAPKYAEGGAIDVDLPEEPEPEVDSNVTIDPVSGSVVIDNDDGSITIDPTGLSLWKPQDDGDPSHADNLADKIDPIELGRIAEDALMAIDSDKQERSQWEQMRAKCIELLGMKLEDPKGDVSRSALGMSTSVVRDPILLEAVERFRANAYAELCPASGPVKVMRWGKQTSVQKDELADSLQEDLNFYLTTVASEYYDDTYYMLWWTGLAGGTFKKIYNCPLRQRPVSESVDGTHLIVPSNATDLQNAARVTHEVMLSKADMRAMQLAGIYRDIDLTEPLPAVMSPVDTKKANIEGKSPMPQRIEDQQYTIYECYCKLDIQGFEHKQNGKVTGLPLPYRVTIDTTSRQILEIRRNWDEADDDKIFKKAQIPFVLFPYSTGLSRIYGSGLGQMGGNIASALTALTRISIDNGMMSNYPGLLKAKGPGRQLTNEIMVPPGGCAEFDTGGAARIQDMFMAMPFKDISPNVMGFSDSLRTVGQRLLGSAELPVGEGKQDAPVGTTLAMIEQANKIEGAVHKRLHKAQSEEIRKLVDLLRDDPEALWRDNPRPAMGEANTDAERHARIARFKQALDDYNITPMSDPNVPSDMHRNLMAMGFKQQIAMNPMTAQAYNQVEVDRWVSKQVFKMGDAMFNSLLAPPQAPQQPQIDPVAAAKLQIDKQNADTKVQQVQLQSQNAQAALKSKEDIEYLKIASQHAAGQDGQPSPMQKVSESLNYKDAPPDVQRQIEMQAGLQPSQIQPVDQTQPQADPLQAAALQLKQQQVHQAGIKMALDVHNAHADRQSKETVKAMDIATRLATHPESQPVVNSELQGLSAFMTPAQQSAEGSGGMAEGGPVVPEKNDAEESVELAMKIANALKQYSQNPGPDRWWN